MQEPNQVIFKIGPEVPIMTKKKFAELIGMSERWVEEEIKEGAFPIVQRGANKAVMINVALYWKQLLSSIY